MDIIIPIIVGWLELCRNIQFWSVDIEQKINQRKRYDRQQDGKVADDRPHL